MILLVMHSFKTKPYLKSCWQALAFHNGGAQVFLPALRGATQLNLEIMLAIPFTSFVAFHGDKLIQSMSGFDYMFTNYSIKQTL